MSHPTQWFNNRKLERLCLLLIGVIMGFLFWKLFSVLQRDFARSKYPAGKWYNDKPECR